MKPSQKPNKLLIKLSEQELKSIINDSITEFYSKKYKLQRTVNEEYQNILKEEYGIDLETEFETDKIANEIKNTFKNTSNIKADENGLKNYIGKMKHRYKNKEITIYYRIINFVSEQIFDEYYNRYKFGAEYNRIKNIIILNIGMYNGGFIIETFHNSLQHELSHIFGEVMSGNHPIPHKEQKMYKTAREQIENPISDLSFELANAVYISFKDEQIAMCNGVDAMFRNRPNNTEGVFFSVQQTNEFKFLYYLKKVIKNIDKYSQLIEKQYFITPNKMINRLKTAYKEYLRRLGRIEIKYKNKESL